MTNEYMGPPWQMDWTVQARTDRDALPPYVREIVAAVRAELVTADDPYFRGIDADSKLPDGVTIEPARSSRPKGPRIATFDHGRGWMRYTFVHRSIDPQIVVEEVFWQ
ncbi:hypothetical protein [Streptomyces chattanoogensis]|uniref:hypothetical protein n=1 Tax=Streptomyces chattanoogensis TaxID=66876 RepID=UPI00062CC27B